MNVTGILETLQEAPAAQETWRHAALEIGAALPQAPVAAMADLASGLARLGSALNPDSWASGVCTGLLLLLSGAQQEAMRRRERADVDEELAAELRLRPSWKRLLKAYAEAGQGLLRPAQLHKATGMNRSQVSRELSDMANARLVEAVSAPSIEGSVEGDGRARVYRLTPRGRRLVDIIAAGGMRESVPQAPLVVGSAEAANDEVSLGTAESVLQVRAGPSTAGTKSIRLSRKYGVRVEDSEELLQRVLGTSGRMLPAEER